MGTYTGIYLPLQGNPKTIADESFRLSEKNSSSTSSICFRVREKNVDIKVVSPLVVHDKYWDSDTLSYKRTTAVPAVEQKLLPEQIASIIEKVEDFFRTRQTAHGLNRPSRDVLHPARAFERNHPNLICRIHEYLEKFDGADRTKKNILSASSAR